MSGGLSAGAFTAAAISTAATVAASTYSIVSSGAQASGAAAEGQVAQSSQQAMQARSQLLETAGGAAGSPLAPGQVAPGNNIFGN